MASQRRDRQRDFRFPLVSTLAIQETHRHAHAQTHLRPFHSESLVLRRDRCCVCDERVASLDRQARDADKTGLNRSHVAESSCYFKAAPSGHSAPFQLSQRRGWELPEAPTAFRAAKIYHFI